MTSYHTYNQATNLLTQGSIPTRVTAQGAGQDSEALLRRPLPTALQLRTGALQAAVRPELCMAVVPVL